jgi:hypothetical protein
MVCGEIVSRYTVCILFASLLSRPLLLPHPPPPRRLSPRHHPGPDCNDYRMPADQLAEIKLNRWRWRRWHTCNLPFNSRSPRSLTNTISSRQRRTRSSGSDTGAEAPSSTSAMTCSVGIVVKNVVVATLVAWNCYNFAVSRRGAYRIFGFRDVLGNFTRVNCKCSKCSKLQPQSPPQILHLHSS